MQRLRFALALTALALAAAPRVALADPTPNCPSYFVDSTHGTCGFTGRFCGPNNSACEYDCEDGIHCFAV